MTWKTQEVPALGASFAQDARPVAEVGENFASVICPSPVCLHCGSALVLGTNKLFCCAGCEVVYDALSQGGLLGYYDLRDRSTQPVGDLHLDRRDYKWLVRHELALQQGGDRYDLRLRIQGLQCAACVWLIEQVFHRQPGALAIEVNSGIGLIALTIAHPFDLRRFVTEVERLGYLLGEFVAGQDQVARTASDTLLLRATITSALAANAMMFSLAIYLGLEAGPLRSFLHSVNFGLSVLAVLIGGPVFVTSALRSLRSGVLHLDLPIALGILLTFAAASWSFVTGTEQAAYYDSLATFIALMLWGRYLQDRVVLSNRHQLLTHAADGGLVCRRMVAQRIEDVPVDHIAEGDRLLIPPGDIVPVRLSLQLTSATCSLDWITGEPEPTAFEPGASIPAGAVNVGSAAMTGQALEGYEHSQLRSLLGIPVTRCHEGPSVMSRFARGYVLLVLSAATVGLVRGFAITGRLSVGLEIATAVCVVSCPCSIGLALPLAQEIVSAKLRRLGLFIRDASFLRRAAYVDSIAFDKTGTLTTGHLQLENPEVLAELGEHGRHVLFAMVAGSGHPHARAVRRALSEQYPNDAVLEDSWIAREEPGQGLELDTGDSRYRLGRAPWACEAGEAGAGAAHTHFSKNGQAWVALHMAEVVRPAAVQECQRLREAGYQLYVVSGDPSARVSDLANTLHMDAARTFPGQTPAEKAARMARGEHARTLMLGDGINDNLALEVAYASGTPSLDRPAVTTRADFYYVTPGLQPIRAALLAARDLRGLGQRSWSIFAIYNGLSVAVAISGIIQPWVAAVIMPASSIASVLYVVATLKQRSLRWTSSS